MNEHELLAASLKQFAGLSDEDFDLSATMWQFQTYKKWNYFNEYKNVCQYLGFVIEGVFRSYIVDGKSGEEKNVFLYSGNQFVVSFKSFINQIPCDYHTQSMTESQVLCIHISDLQRLYKQSHAWERFGRLLAQEAFNVTMERTESFLFKTPEERYLDLIKHHPDVFNTIPLYHISSYLGIQGPSFEQDPEKEFQVNNPILTQVKVFDNFLTELCLIILNINSYIMKKSKTIVLIHGNFVNDLTWKQWKHYYEQKGYTVYTPANPGHNGNPETLRNNVHPDLKKTNFKDVVDNISNLIDTLPEKPLVIGHSMAGMAALKLTDLDKVAAAVSIDGAPPKNVFPPFQTLKTVLPAFGFFSGKKTFMGSRKWYDYAFFNTLPDTEKEKMFNEFAVPESFSVSRQLVLDSYSNINFTKAHTPLLFIGGGSDHIFPAELTKKIAGKYKDQNSITNLKIYDGKSHFIAGEPGWESIADDILNWYESL